MRQKLRLEKSKYDYTKDLGFGGFDKNLGFQFLAVVVQALKHSKSQHRIGLAFT